MITRADATIAWTWTHARRRREGRGHVRRVQPEGGVTYKLVGTAPTAAVNVYGTYSQAFLPPRRPSSLLPADVPLDLQPENIENYEGGLKASLLEAGSRSTLRTST